MLALLVETSFYEAFFRAHYTETSPLSYPAPLPTTVAGIFGAMLGWDRRILGDIAGSLFFGSKLLDYKGECREYCRIIQFEKGLRPVRPPPVMRFELLYEPTILVAMAGDPDLVRGYLEKLEEGFEYLPYGGRNEYFVKDITVKGCREVNETDVIESYCPENWVSETITGEGGWVRMLQVMHRIKDASRWFSFVYKGKLKLSRKVPVVEGICLYPFSEFYWSYRGYE